MVTENANPTASDAAKSQAQKSQAQLSPGTEKTESATKSKSDRQQKLQRQEAYPTSLTSGVFPLSPFTLFRRVFEDMDRAIDDIGLARGLLPNLGGGMTRGSRGGGGLDQALWAPQVEIFEKDGQLVVRADLPGMKENDVRIEVVDDMLVIEGERKYEHEDKEGGVLRSERSYGFFRRVLPLPEGIDLENAEATFENGVLQIAMKLPQSEQRRRRIELKKSDKDVH
jgi:HSP20 family protein